MSSLSSPLLIGFIGAPGCGKTTTALGLAFYLKQAGYTAEFIPEAARKKIIEARVSGLGGNGGQDGQRAIYEDDTYMHALYRHHGNALSITDGSTINCFFYGYDHLDLVHECKQYDVLFYIPLLDTAYRDNDVNRLQQRAEILEMGLRWEETIRPLQAKLPHIITLEGYPAYTNEQMIRRALEILQVKSAIAA